MYPMEVSGSWGLNIRGIDWLYLYTMSHSQPTILLLDKELHSLSWNDVKRLALHLDDCMTNALLEDIEHDRAEVTGCKIAAMEEWLKRDGSASWGKVVSALRTVSMHALASHVESEYCKPSTTPQPSTPSESGSVDPSVLFPQLPTEPTAHLLCPMEPQSSLTPASPQLSQLEYQAASDNTASYCGATVSGNGSRGDRMSKVKAIREEAAYLQGQFMTLLWDTRTYFIEIEKMSSRFLRRFKLTLKILPLSKRHQHLLFLKEEKQCIMNATDVDEIFDILEPYWNYVDYALLEFLVKEFGTEELQQKMKQYIAELELFEKKTSVEDFDLAVKDKRVLRAHFRTVTVTQSKDPAKCSLYEVRQLKNEVVNRSTLSEYAVYLQGVKIS